ncbi:hypothetical protein [Methanococcus maripaludis]|uniref:C-di-AMP phosphodiesterase-like protein n=3 Tax=Methanococcus maripaludis TaxID=39152 RepID=A0A7J9NWG1_METMI|nr:hypothetical protein [Methanococcus maripaludis]MBA2845964.1 c-di-AMP phosphodiesterase-like protein [Methanococcus maripaludis]MBA2852020.1 c-di-AMP phosphodiesterase-like protein [Methanococcus maripaludis]MBB6068214.1 c-di-AMP phosphodiesterase-like protein [Methanococcus maripaludis]MBG0769388.1 hypothetical protein [Methanococcus maripaludis]BAP60294.1 hypothetical protein MMKA1_01770 [Methanococcus maripaludis KA1]
MNIDLFTIVNSLSDLLFNQVYDLCGMFYPMFIGGIVSMFVFFVFKSVNKSIIALIVTAIVIFALPTTPYECRLVAVILAAVSSVFFVILFRKVR